MDADPRMAVACEPSRGGRSGAATLAAAVFAGVVVIAMGPWSKGASAQPASTSYQIPRQSIDGGAGRTASASYTLEGTLGQADAGATMNSASYRLHGGFHRGAADAPSPDPLFTDSFEPR